MSADRALHVVKDDDRQIMPPLDAEVEAALRDSIREFGVIIPITVDQNGEIIDGHNRLRIAGLLGVDCPANVVEVADEPQALAIALSVNADRRQMTAAQRAQVARTLRDRGHSQRAIAEVTGVSRGQVQRDIVNGGEQLAHKGPVASSDDLDQVTGLNGKVYPARSIEWTYEMKQQALTLHKAGMTYIQLAAEFRVSKRRIGQILREARDTPSIEAKATAGKSRDAVAAREQAIREMADTGAHSQQIASTLGVTETAVRRTARRLGIEIIGDKALGRSRRPDSNRIVEQAAIALDGVTTVLHLINYAALDADRIEDWATSIDESLRALSRFRNQLNNQVKEMTQ